MVEDLGSGWLGWPERGELPEALRDEPIVSESIAAGADVGRVFSGDKMLGGPQAGIIAGTQETLDVIRRHPLMRALRVDKLTYAALEATLEEHAIGRGSDVPVLQMLRADAQAIGARAEAVASSLRGSGWHTSIASGTSTIGGGSAPGSEIPTRLLVLECDGMSAAEIDARLRSLDPPVIARIQENRVVLDLLTVDPLEDERITQLLSAHGATESRM